MKRMTTFLLFCLAATVASARVRAAAVVTEQQPLAAGFVSSVNAEAKTIGIDNDMIIIDAAAADIITNESTDPLPFSAIKPGMEINAVLMPGTFTAGQHLPARIVQILLFPHGSLTGALEAVDQTNGTFTILGQPIRVNERTRFSGSVAGLDPKNLGELAAMIGPSTKLTVSLAGNAQQLTAANVYVIAPTPDQMVSFTGVLDHINGDTWFLTNSQYSSFKVVSTTSIIGPVFPNTYITVFARIDSGVVTAVSILPALRPCGAECAPPNPIFRLTGVLTKRSATSITLDEGKNIYDVAVTADTIFEGDPAVGDNVSLEVEQIAGGLHALRVTKVTTSLVITVIDTVTEMASDHWTVGHFNVLIRDSTQIIGTIHVGDKVRVLGDRQPGGDVVARVIDKP
jgi:hypothetical protein